MENETQRLQELEAIVAEIKFYVQGHKEPGYECVQCLIEALVDGKLKPGAAEPRGSASFR